MHTSDEAKNMRCCGPAGCGAERGTMQWNADDRAATMIVSERYCIGDQCMAWQLRWEHRDQQADIPAPGKEWERHGPVTSEGGFVTKRQNWRRPVGFCRLAGRPE